MASKQAKTFEREVAEMRVRDLLHLRHIDEFAAFCELDGWMRVETKGLYEVLRMARPDTFNGNRQWLIVHRRDHTLAGDFNNVQHAVVFGNSAVWVKKFYRGKRNALRPLTRRERGA